MDSSQIEFMGPVEPDTSPTVIAAADAPTEPVPVTDPDPEPADPGNGNGENLTRLVKRQRIFLGVALAAALASIGGLLASTLIKSPAQQAADQGPPPASVLTAPVQREVLKQTVVVRGTVVAGGAVSFTPTASGSGAGAGSGAAALVITAEPMRPGAQIHAGDVLIQVSGRPVIALPGATPAYRDLKPGDNGADVAQLQSALGSLGYSDADSSGQFGSGTKDAIAALYRHLGYDPPTTGGPGDAGDRAALNNAQQAVTTAQRAVTTDREALAAAKGDTATAQARQALQWAQQDLDTARQNQAQLVSTTGVDLPLSEFVFLSSFPATLTAVSGTVGSAVSSPLLTIDTGHLVVNATVLQGDNALIKAGLPVQLDDEVLGQSAAATVASIGAFSPGGSGAGSGSSGGSGGSSGSGGSGGSSGSGSSGSSGGSAAQQAPGYPVVITPTSPLSPAWLGADVRVTITAGSTGSEVLVVPVAAINTGVDQTTTVTVQRPDGTQRTVQVQAGVTANGFVQVSPVGSAELGPGDRVVVGR